MNPLTRLSWALGASLLIWTPVAISTITGHVDPSISGLYYLGALGLGWFGTAIISSIFSGYRNTIDQAEEAKRQIALMEAQAAELQRRRATDKSPDEEI